MFPILTFDALVILALASTDNLSLFSPPPFSLPLDPLTFPRPASIQDFPQSLS